MPPGLQVKVWTTILLLSPNPRDRARRWRPRPAGRDRDPLPCLCLEVEAELGLISALPCLASLAVPFGDGWLQLRVGVRSDSMAAFLLEAWYGMKGVSTSRWVMCSSLSLHPRLWERGTRTQAGPSLTVLNELSLRRRGGESEYLQQYSTASVDANPSSSTFTRTSS